MGAKTSLLGQLKGDARQTLAALPLADEASTSSFVASLFPDARFDAPRPANLLETYVRDGTVLAGCFAGLRLLVARELAVDRPSRLPAKFLATEGTTILHAMHSVVDWFAFAVWQDGRLQRSLSVAPDSGVLEDIGDRLAFEVPYWQGLHPALEPPEDASDYPLPFHPLELGEAALREFFGFQLESDAEPQLLEPRQVRMWRFEASSSRRPRSVPTKRWWRFW